MSTQAIDGVATARANVAALLSQAAAPASVPRPSASPQSARPAPGARPTADPARIHEALDSINSAMRAMNRSLKFSIDTDSQTVVVKVIDRETGEVVRQIPAEEALRIRHALHTLKGLLIGEKA